ncbi:MAG: Diaminopimelate decarboxylase [Alphaproteobacteria bacterium MarineAlpha5_Bin11]|nr:MAG: Diaminopimelate decarboxylase [Alphaproteobacteria bacterium MarineAlpha5_Bin11]PPR51400.1 MAG: Diaminopimelate decarboxylase [Alphaproteobacteria bacterium MarineAlpha5_Bin10]|tara:strand:- start:38996 stop:40246 length:1251 start_codon:yes stop_codon:yes gene_type:complete
MNSHYIKNNLAIENVLIKDLVKKFKTPLYVYSLSTIKKNYVTLKKKLGHNIYYSVKANSNQSIIKILSKLGSGIDVVSGEELMRALAAKVAPKKIIFEGVGKTKNDLILAIKKGIKQINVESIEELLLINKTAKSLGKIANVGIRINPNIDAKSLKKISTGNKKDKFGIPTTDLNQVVIIAKKSKNINLKGISCHVGSQIFSLSVYEKVFKKIKETARFFINNNINIKNLNLGGGMGFDKTKNKKFQIKGFKKLVDKHFRNLPYEISFEPGRYIVAESGTLIAKIITTKKSGQSNFIILDAGMNIFLRPALYGAHHNIVSIIKRRASINYNVAGPICESSDIFGKNVFLPKQYTGDYVAIQDVGAYGSVMSSNYNSKELAAEILIYKNRFTIIRKRQKIKDLISKDIIPRWLGDFH